MGGGGQGSNTPINLAGGVSELEQQRQDWYQNLMDEVQFGSRTPRLPIPYQATPGPQYDPKPVPIMQGPAGGDYFNPYYSSQDALFMAQNLRPGGAGVGGEINPAQLAQILTRLGYA